MKLLQIFATISVMALLGGCVDGSGTNGAPSRGISEFTHAANGNVYRLRYKYDGILGAYGTELTVVSGTPFTGALTEDTLAQNTIRDAFRKQKICGEGQYPGILQFGYGPFNLGESWAWGGKVRCSTTAQANV